MVNRIHGIDVILYERTRTGEDAFRAPVYEEKPVTVQNVLVTPVTAEEVTADLQLYGKRAAYELCLPKGDAHNWAAGSRVDFFGGSWRVFGPVTGYIEANLPLAWNKKVKVERYG